MSWQHTTSSGQHVSITNTTCEVVSHICNTPGHALPKLHAISTGLGAMQATVLHGWCICHVIAIHKVNKTCVLVLLALLFLCQTLPSTGPGPPPSELRFWFWNWFISCLARLILDASPDRVVAGLRRDDFQDMQANTLQCTSQHWSQSCR